jgi:hypothetical protein
MADTGGSFVGFVPVILSGAKAPNFLWFFSARLKPRPFKTLHPNMMRLLKTLQLNMMDTFKTLQMDMVRLFKIFFRPYDVRPSRFFPCDHF